MTELAKRRHRRLAGQPPEEDKNMDFDRVVEKVDGIPNMTPQQGRRIYDHLRETGATRVLELGTAHGVSAAYMAAAIEESGGMVTTVDHAVATKLRDPQPGPVLERTGLSLSVNRVLVEDSSYTWWLGQQIESQTRSGQCRPMYDFVYIDGAHNWTIDGFSFVLVEKLLRPDGWLLLDDLGWAYGAPGTSTGPGQGPDALGLSSAECALPHMQRVFDLLVTQHASFGNFLVQDDDWGWAQKIANGDRVVRHESTAGWRDRLQGRAVARKAIDLGRRLEGARSPSARG
jgi:predicted O-methyltransferase YrrM